MKFSFLYEMIRAHFLTHFGKFIFEVFNII